MKFSKVAALLLALLLAAAHFAVNTGLADQTSRKAEKSDLTKAGDSPEEEIVKNPLKPPDTSSVGRPCKAF